MPAGTKRKKHQDRDKYYRLAKEQGLRSRASFKLSQINRKYRILTPHTPFVLDLCAAPGGWSQICSRILPKTSRIISVDILPIRSLGPSVTTVIGDITTSKCQSEINRCANDAKIDVVLCDGAPNVGASYDKDAFNQNEIALSALKCATKHLKANGTFMTKIYRSKDYTAYLWVVKQFFRKVDAVKPTASRMQSAEMYLVCQGYLNPTKIDSKMFDPRVVFEEVEDNNLKPLSVFSKAFGMQKRFRQGYDMRILDATMRNIGSVKKFVEQEDPIGMLSSCTGLSFTCDECELGECKCKFYLNHKLTTSEIRTCLSDLKVLGKGDFKGIINWRLKLKAELLSNADTSSKEKGEVEVEENEDEDGMEDGDDDGSDKEEDDIQEEIAELGKKRLREKKKSKKKERKLAAKKRKRISLGLDLNSSEVPDNDKIFSLASITSKGDLEAIREIDLNEVDEGVLPNENDVEEEFDSSSVQAKEEESEDENGYSYRLDRELDEAYDLYLSETKSSEAKQGTKMAKRVKKRVKMKAMENAAEDDKIMESLQGDTVSYAKLLQGPKDSDDEDEDDESDDGFHSVPLTPVEFQKQNENPLIHKLPETQSQKRDRWFSNPVFSAIQSATQEATVSSLVRESEAAKEEDSDIEVDNLESEEEDNVTAREVIASIPKTDKQIRHEKRVRDIARQERKKAKRAARAGERPDFEIAEPDEETTPMNNQQKQKLMEARELIKKGMGAVQKSKDNGFKVVPAEADPLPVLDARRYDSDHEEYDSDDQARTLALGTMMLRRSKAKALVDASYNRYAWNDPADLPEWLIDDENRNYRPQLPIPPQLVQKMKERYLQLAEKPIAKVAQARARKNKRVKDKLQAAKKRAEAVANSSDMTEAMKLKSISKAMRAGDKSKPGKTYVVSQKGGKTRGRKGVKLVDKRMKNDKRSLSRSSKKKKSGKQGGLTGSKKRRRHS